MTWLGWGYCHGCNEPTGGADWCSDYCAVRNWERDPAPNLTSIEGIAYYKKGTTMSPSQKKSTRVPRQLDMLGAKSAERGPEQDADLPDRKRWVASIRSVPIKTARYSNRNVAGSGLQAVRITRYPPRWRLPYDAKTIMELAPTPDLLKVAKGPDGHRLFDEGFGAQLAKLHPEELAGKLLATGNGRGLVLLCYEDLRKPGEYCHRQQVAAWLEAQYAIQVEELPE